MPKEEVKKEEEKYTSGPLRGALHSLRLETKERGWAECTCLSLCFSLPHLRFKDRVYEINLLEAITVLLMGECNEGEN